MSSGVSGGEGVMPSEDYLDTGFNEKDFDRITQPQCPAPEAPVTPQSSIKELIAAMETCHYCHAAVIVAPEIIHCEDCPSGCESHDPPDCPTIQELHARAKRELEKHARPRVMREQALYLWETPGALSQFIDRLRELGIDVED